MKNKYAHHSKISEAKLRQIVRLFALDLNALQIAELAGVNRNTVNRYLAAFRERIAGCCEKEAPGRLRTDMPPHVQQRTGPGTLPEADCQTGEAIFGLFRHHERVYAEPVPGCSLEALQKLIRGRASLENVLPDKAWLGYDGLVDLGGQKLFRLPHSHMAAPGRSFVGIESFWAYAKARLQRFRGIQKQMLYLNLKECEFRFNHRHDDMYQLMLKMLRENPLR